MEELLPLSLNSPEATALLRASRTDTFWREVLQHAIDGDLQAVLDEHAHYPLEAEGLQDELPAEAALTISEAVGRALGVRASSLSYTSVATDGRAVAKESKRLHTAFAVRFGDDEGEATVDGQRPARSSQLRDAFNSLYWPSSLSVPPSVRRGSTSIRIAMSWFIGSPDQPRRPRAARGTSASLQVPRDQKNAAARHRNGALKATGDPWKAAFELAALERLPADSELVPYWIYPDKDGAAVERHVLALPLSRELDRFERLRQALTVYREPSIRLGRRM